MATKAQLIDQTFDAIRKHYEIWKQLYEAVQAKRLPGMTIGCSIDYHRDKFYEQLKHKRKTKKWYFEYRLCEITETNKKMAVYLETGKWPTDNN